MTYNFTKQEIALLVAITKNRRFELDQYLTLVGSDDKGFLLLMESHKKELDKLLRAFLQDPYIDEEMIDYRTLKED